MGSFSTKELYPMKRNRYFRINCIALLLCLLLGFVYQAGASAGSFFSPTRSEGNLSNSSGVITNFCRIGSDSIIAKPTEKTGEITDSVFRVIQNSVSRDRLDIPLTLFIIFALIWALLFIFEFHIVIPSITASLRMIIHYILSKDGQKSILS